MSTVVDVRERYSRNAALASASILRATAKLRRDLDDVDAAINDGLRVPSTVSGDSFVESNARDLARSIAARQAAYDVLALLDGIERAS